MEKFKDFWKCYSGSEILPENVDIERAYTAGQHSRQEAIARLENNLAELLEQNLTLTKKIELQGKALSEVENLVDNNFDEDRDDKDDVWSFWSGYNKAYRELKDFLNILG